MVNVKTALDLSSDLKVYCSRMKIAELAGHAGIASSAVRWYESQGVIPEARRRDNGYREYGETDLARLRLVVSLRRLGLGPEDAGGLARLCLERGSVDLDLSGVSGFVEFAPLGSRRSVRD